MHCDEGQAAIDYVGLLTVVSVVLAVALALRGEPQAFAGAVDRAFARGICIVRGGTCDADQQPCVVASDKLAQERHVNVVVASIGKDRYLLRERRSDGTIAITDFHGKGFQIGGSKGGSVRFKGIELGGEVSASMLMRSGSGSVYVTGSQRQADAFQRAILGDGEGLPAPSERFGERRSKRDYGVSASIVGQEIAGAGFQAGDRDSSRVAVDGSRTVVYAHGDGWDLSVLGRTLADQERAETYAVRLDPAGRPLELIATVLGDLDGVESLPASVVPAASTLLARAGAAGERSFVVEAHLDLGDPANAALAADFVDEVRHPRVRIGSVLGPTERLRERLRREGTIEARAYAVAHEQLGSPDSIGYGGSARRERSTLVAAVSRSYDGSWRSREDCLS